MILVRLLLYLAACAYLVLVLPGAGDAFLANLRGLHGSVRAGEAAARAFALGAGLFVPIALLVRTPLRFWYTLAHELSHGIAAMALGGHPDELHASSSGHGKVTFLRAPMLFWLVLLAPYVLNPSHLVPVLVPLLRADARVWGAGAAGFATAFALVANGIQIRAYQSDIREAGLLRSLLFIAWGNLVAITLAMALALRGYGAAARALRTSLIPVWPL